MTDFRGKPRMLRRIALLVLLASAAAACSSQSGTGPAASTGTAAGSASPASMYTGPVGGGLNDSVDVQAMLSSWGSGTCPATGNGWGGFSHGLAIPSSSAAKGSALTLAPTGVDRVLLCRFADASSKLDGSALITGSAPVSQLATALNSVKAANSATCTGTDRVMILLGEGQKVAGLDMAVGGCSYVGGPGQVGAYNGTALLQIVDADLGKN